VARVAFIVTAPLLLASTIALITIALPTPETGGPPPASRSIATTTAPLPDFQAEREHFAQQLADEQRAALASPELAGRPSLAEPKLSTEGKQAYDTLIVADRFESSRVGASGAMPNSVRSLRTLLTEKHAAVAFRSLLTRATLAGQLYALCGLYIVDHERFLVEVKP
jgi:hypothetical protein